MFFGVNGFIKGGGGGVTVNNWTHVWTCYTMTYSRSFRRHQAIVWIWVIDLCIKPYINAWCPPERPHKFITKSSISHLSKLSLQSKQISTLCLKIWAKLYKSIIKYICKYFVFRTVKTFSIKKKKVQYQNIFFF